MAALYNLAFPYDLDAHGNTAETLEDTHIRHLVEQVLFTSPGERVNRPDFACGLLRLTFEPNSDALAATLQFTVQGALQQWLGDRIDIERVQIDYEDSTLRITVAYRIRRTGRRDVATFEEER